MRALKEAKLAPLGGQAIQWLTIYEVLNAIWKETYLLRKLKPEEGIRLARVFVELTKEMSVLEPRGLELEILRLAILRGITVYDASYVALARSLGLTLVTEDRKLAIAARDLVEVTSLDGVR